MKINEDFMLGLEDVLVTIRSDSEKMAKKIHDEFYAHPDDTELHIKLYRELEEIVNVGFAVVQVKHYILDHSEKETKRENKAAYMMEDESGSNEPYLMDSDGFSW
jgi:hypothetical protein